MAITTEVNTLLADQMFAIFSHAETLMLDKVAKRVARGITQEGWTERKAKEIFELRQEIEKITLDTGKLAHTHVDKAVRDAFKSGVKSAEQDFGLPATILSETAIPVSLQRLVLETNNMIAKTSFNILRDVDDTFRTIQAEVATGVLSGVETRKQIAQRMLNKFADSGVASFTDKLGRVWEMAAYAEMATRTVTARAALQGHVDRQSEAGRDLVVVSSHGGCPICRPWEGRILSISGVSKQYPSLADAQSAGLFHPNCSHSITGYIPGLTVLEDKPQRTPEQYEYTQRQRANERAIRQWKRRETVALTPEEAQKARAKIQAYQQRQREMLNEYENKFGMTLRRKYDRESITNRTGKRGINNSPAWASMKPRKIQAPKRPQTKKPPNVVKPVFNPNIYKNVSREQLEGYTSKFWGYS